MKTSFVSNIAVQNAMRATISQGQLEMIKLQQESSTGKHADNGVALGSSTSRAVNMKSELERLENIKDTNSIVTQRLSASQMALDQMRTSAEQIRTTLIAAMGTDDSDRLNTATTDINGALSTFSAAANTQFNGEFLMAGINTDVRPLTEYTATSPAKASFDLALSTFMSANSISTMADFTPAQMTSFITGTLEPMYTGTQWDTDWSNASDQNMTSRISANEVVSSSTNANTDGVRLFALAAVLSSELLGADISPGVRSAVTVAARDYAQASTAELIETSSVLGVSESRVEKANTTLESQIKLVKDHLIDIEGIDVYEATTRINSLKSQIEMSYTLTARLQAMSLINFL